MFCYKFLMFLKNKINIHIAFINSAFLELPYIGLDFG